MWRFILLSFVFLGWGFYEMSGGAEYRPSANSIQMRATLDNQRPKPRPLRVNVIEIAQDGLPQPDTRVTRTVTSLHGLGLTMGQRVEVTLASAAEGDVSRPSAAVEPVEPDLAGPETPEITVPTVAVARSETPIGVAVPGDAVSSFAPVTETRRVAGTSVNLRTGPGTAFGAITSLARGTEVIVLRDPGNGWIKLRVAGTGRIGWMADRLLTVASE
ncbi:Bacterial SH3 domain protein [Roseovarius tolerans]|uniref:Bacterial SH3 domain protein n=1 Tax=Roseovarius tolerans TaxID=74031 RepID=A0A0L6CQL2_9RHOB|nr:SH3 domain-containing protein [Roseovarius tolerans]KNX40011.1 Bacterial SH3 domain protein [Roseovarius tolerans]